MSDERIRLKLKAAGYARTVTGIHLKLKRMRFKEDVSFYSANGLARALGIDNHAVARWIRAAISKPNIAVPHEPSNRAETSISSTRKMSAASSSNTPPTLTSAKWTNSGFSI